MKKEHVEYLVKKFIIGKAWTWQKPGSADSFGSIDRLQRSLGEDWDAREMLGMLREHDNLVLRRAFIKAIKPVLIFKRWKNGCRVQVQDKYGTKYLITEDPAKYNKLAIAHGIPDGIGKYRVQLRCSMPWMKPETAVTAFFSFEADRCREGHRSKYNDRRYQPFRKDYPGSVYVM